MKIDTDYWFEVNAAESAGFHDMVYEAFNKSCSPKELRDIFNTLPTHIQMSAIEWGLSDTVFRDNAYIYLKKNKEKYV